MMRYRVILGVCAVLACKQREQPPVEQAAVPPPLPPARPDSVAPPANTVPAPPAFPSDHPLLVALRKRESLRLTDASIVEERIVSNSGRAYHIVVFRTVYDNHYTNYQVKVVDFPMTETVRAVAYLRSPWPDYRIRIDSVTSDSVYLTGTSPAYRRTLSLVYPWVPLNVGPSPPKIERPASALTAPACGATVRVDLEARTIAGIWLNQSIDDLKREVGAANVTADTGYAEGQPYLRHHIKLCGHEILRGWNNVSWTDSAFRTAEDLGVGSTLAAFDTLHGRGEAIGEEGNRVRYATITGNSGLFVDVPNGCYSMADRHWEVDRSCRATRLSLLVLVP